MTRARANRRRVVKKPRQWPKITVNWTCVLVVPGAVLLLGAGLLGARAALDHPVRQLRIEGGFQRVTPIQVEAALAPGLHRGFLSADLSALQGRVEALDWVASAEVARLWPDTLVVRVAEHRAAARWGSHGLLNTRGELFTTDARYVFPELPRLNGPAGTESEVAARYLALRGRLAEANMALEELVMDERGAWRIELEGGQEIRVGRRDVDQRLDRLFRVVAPVLAPRFHRVSHVDLRYTNGFSVGWIAEEPLQLAGGNGVPGNG